jgi:hypothetical protein
MAMTTRGPLHDIYFGFNLKKLFIRIDCTADARISLKQFHQIKIGFLEPAGHQVIIDISNQEKITSVHLLAGKEVPASIEIALQKVVEFSIPFETLDVHENQLVSFYVEILENGLGRDRAPREGLITFSRPTRDFEQIMWDV